ncbi:beta-galactosidase GalA [Paenibacillus humicus]|uniref:beta-galactosidase GalA n=1 Tax=Paenibacillus humicus TaxID=412861 RepID=UPI003D283D9B
MRERLSMDRDWRFHLGDPVQAKESSHKAVYGLAKAGGIRGPAGMEWNDNEWDTVQLPHDWSYQQPLDRENGVPDFGYYPRGIGWYRKKFKLDPADQGKQLLLEFDGIATHAAVYFNGSILERNFCGYTSFTVDITDRAYFGDQPNLLVVKVDATVSEGWWYEGAGIYRHVWLTKTAPVHIAHRGIWVNPIRQEAGRWLTNVETTIRNETEAAVEYQLISRVEQADGNIVAEELASGSCAAGQSLAVTQDLPIEHPALWDVDAPHLYKLYSILVLNGEEVDTAVTNYGYRTIRICPDTGFYLNDRPLKIKGTCNHQDHAGVGVALPDGIQEYRIRRLKEMGSNAYRCAHHNPAPELLDACDRLGMLVMNENRNFDSSREGLRQLENMVTRDRNHPSVVFYSLFNEEPLQGTPIGRKMVKRMIRAVKKLDPTRPILGAMHGGVMEDEGAADVTDIVGFNYMNGGYDKFREKHPNQPIIGSETVSAFSTRGNYISDDSRQIFDSYDREKASWGNSVRESWKTINTRDFVMGTFVWTGFDYRGEPTPYEWPSVSTHFGIMDTCGFAKDSYYLYQAFWRDEPVLHIVGHWNWPGREGRQVKIMAHTNCDEVALYLNDVLIDRQPIDIYEQYEWDVVYEPGTLRMEGYKGGQLVKAAEIQTADEAHTVRVETQKLALSGDGRDAMAVNVYAVDGQGRFVPTEQCKMSFSIKGSGVILGVGNGDPNCHEPDYAAERSLFNGCCQLIVQSKVGEEDIVLTIEGDGLQPASHVIPVQPVEELPFVPSVDERYINNWLITQEIAAERPDPNVMIHPTDMNSWEMVDVSFGALQMLRGASGYVTYRNQAPISDVEKSGRPYLWFHSISGDIEIYVDGRLQLKQFLPWPENLEVPLLGAELKDQITISVLIGITSDMYSPGIQGSVSIRTK